MSGVFPLKHMVLVCLLVDCNFYIPAEQQDILFVTKINYPSEGHLASSRKKREKTKRDMKYYSNSNILMMHITIFAAFQVSSHCLMIYTLITWKPGGNALITSEYVHTNFSKRINIDTLTQRETTKTATTVKTKHIQQLIQFRLTNYIAPLPVQYLQSTYPGTVPNNPVQSFFEILEQFYGLCF